MWQEMPGEFSLASNDSINIGMAQPSSVPSVFLQQQFLVDPWQTQLLVQSQPVAPARSVAYFTLVPSAVIVHADKVPTTTTSADPPQATAMSSPAESVEEVCVSSSTRSVRAKRVFEGRCVVCGDVATGMHYAVASCNGCKTFFRRTFMSGRRYICSKDGKCGMNPKARCTCRACRFKKCLAAGMDPEVLQPSREPNPVRRASHAGSQNNTIFGATKDIGVLRGSLNFRTDTPSSSSSSSSNNSCTLPVPPHLDTKYLQDKIHCDDLRDLVTREVKFYALKRCGGYRGGAILDILTRPPAIEIQSLMEISTNWPVFLDAQSRTKFWLNYELSISIEYAKTHEVFKNLSFCDKCLLLEDTHVALFLFTAAYETYFNQGKSIQYTNGDEVVFGDDTGSPTGLFEMMVQCSLDPASFAISKSMIFLNPDIMGLSTEGRTHVKAERDRYLRLLSSYLFQKFGDVGASILGDCILLSSTALSLGRRLRQQSPANAPLLYLTTPLPVDDL